jgi:hypothetical protein
MEDGLFGGSRSHRGTRWGWMPGGERDVEVDLLGWTMGVGIRIYMASVLLLQVGAQRSVLDSLYVPEPSACLACGGGEYKNERDI